MDSENVVQSTTTKFNEDIRRLVRLVLAGASAVACRGHPLFYCHSKMRKKKYRYHPGTTQRPGASPKRYKKDRLRLICLFLVFVRHGRSWFIDTATANAQQAYLYHPVSCPLSGPYAETVASPRCFGGSYILVQAVHVNST